MLAEFLVVDEHAAGGLIGYEAGDQHTPAEAEHEVERDREIPDPMKLIVPGQVVSGGGAEGGEVEEEAEGHVASRLLLALGQQITVRVMLDLLADVSRVLSHFVFSLFIL